MLSLLNYTLIDCSATTNLSMKTISLIFVTKVNELLLLTKNYLVYFTIMLYGIKISFEF